MTTPSENYFAQFDAKSGFRVERNQSLIGHFNEIDRILNEVASTLLQEQKQTRHLLNELEFVADKNGKVKIFDHFASSGEVIEYVPNLEVNEKLQHLFEIIQKKNVAKAHEIHIHCPFTNIQPYLERNLKTSAKPSLLTRFINAISYYRLHHNILIPFLKDNLTMNFKDMSRTQIENVYQSSSKLITDTWIEALKKEPNLENLISKEKFTENVQQEIRRLILKKAPHMTFSESEKQKLNCNQAIERLIQKDAHATLFFPAEDDFHFLETQRALDISFEKLSRIPIDEKNKRPLFKLWKKKLLELKDEGDLTKHAQYQSKMPFSKLLIASQYIQARDLFPEQLKEPEAPYLSTFFGFNQSAPTPVRSFLKELDNQVDEKLKASVNLSFPGFGELLLTDVSDPKKRIWLEKIRPHFLTLANEKLSKKDDLILALSGGFFDRDQLIKEVFSKLAPAEQEEVSEKAISHFLDGFLEQRASELALLSDAQINTLRAIRAEPGTKDINHSKISLFNDEAIGDITSPQNGDFSREELAGMMLVNRVLVKLEQKNPLTKEEKQRVAAFLEMVSTHPTINQRLAHYIKKDDPYEEMTEKLGVPALISKAFKLVHRTEPTKLIPFGIDQKTLNFLRYASFKSSHMKLYAHALAKTEKLLGALDNPGFKKIPPLTLREFGRLVTLRDLKETDFFENLKSMGILDNASNSTFNDLNRYCERASGLMDSLDEKVMEYAKNYYQGGDLVATMGSKMSRLMGRKLALRVEWTARICGYTHGGALFKDKNQNIALSEINADHEKTLFLANDLLSSDIYRMDVTKLIDPGLKTFFEGFYGKEWKVKIQEMFSEESTQTHRAFNQANVHFEEERALEAGRANFDPLLRLLLRGNREDFPGHTRTKDRDFHKIAKKFKQGNLSEEMICSEFVTKATITTLIELNKKISAAIKNHAESPVNKALLQARTLTQSESLTRYLNQPEAFFEQSERNQMRRELDQILKGMNYDKKTRKLIILTHENNLLELPYSPKERLRAIHPGRMISLLKKRNCIAKVPLPDDLKKIFSA